MSGWGFGFFGGGATARRSEAPKKAILQLRSQLEMLSKREKHLQNQMEEQDGLARKYINSNKNGTSPSDSLLL
jgi:charged multivesicular body protein 4